MYNQGAYNQQEDNMGGGQPDPNNFYNPPNQHQPQQVPYQPQPVPMQQQQQQTQQFEMQGKRDSQQHYSYAPRGISPTPPAQQNGFYSANSYANEPQLPPAPPQNFYGNGHFNNGNSSPTPPSYTSSFNPSSSPQPTHQGQTPVSVTHGGSDFAAMNGQTHQSGFYGVPQQQQQYQQGVQHQQHPQHGQQQPLPGMQGAMPFMMAGLQQMGIQNGQTFNAALGTQLFQTLAPGAAGYTNQFFGEAQSSVPSFLRVPKYYFAVNHRYVLKKLSLLLMPFTNRTWARQRGMDPGQFEGNMNDSSVPTYLPPRDDVNAPDLYIPLMAFWTYVMMVGFVFGMRNQFSAEILAKYISKGFGLLSLEVAIIKLGLYLINARYTPLLDVIAYRGYKFVGVVLTMIAGLIAPRIYWPTLLYSAIAMGIFLMRSHRRIILPRDVDVRQAQDLARRNGFLLFLSILQIPIYALLVLDVRR